MPAWTLHEIVERVWLRIGTGQSSSEKKLWRDEIGYLINEALVALGDEVANSPDERHVLQTLFTIPVIAPLGACDIGDASAGKNPALSIITRHIYQVDNLAVSGLYTVGHKMAHQQDLTRKMPLGRLWWTLRDNTLETIAPDGTTRLSDGGNTLDGTFYIRANYVPTVAILADKGQLQKRAVEHLERICRGKRDDMYAQKILEAAA